MYKKIALFSVIFTVGLLGSALSVKAANAGSNLVSVYSCEQVGRNVRVKTSSSASAYILNSSCRDAGHGMRSYNLTCTSATQYRVQWTDCSNRPIDNTGPSVVADVTYAAVWSSNQVNKVVPILTAQATDTSKVTKIVLYYTPGSGEGYRVVKTCDNLTARVGNCSYRFNESTKGYYYAMAWDGANNSKGSAILSF